MLVRGVLFDAGGVLTRPIGGRWNPRHDFESIVTAHHPGVRQDLFAEGSRLLGLQPHECLFVDDDPALVAAAEALGYHGRTLDRAAKPPVPAGVIASLDELIPALTGDVR